jgi:hypothetical protein
MDEKAKRLYKENYQKFLDEQMQKVIAEAARNDAKEAALRKVQKVREAQTRTGGRLLGTVEKIGKWMNANMAPSDFLISGKQGTRRGSKSAKRKHTKSDVLWDPLANLEDM